MLPSFAAGAQQPLPTAPFLVFLDAAHGGEETGTTLAPQLLEKNINLAMSVHLRSALAARGMGVLTTREGDTNPTLETRAAAANHAQPAACLVIHATASGAGVHVYTSSLSQSSEPGGSPAVWSSAQARFATRSLELASAITAALESAEIPFTLGRLRMQPLDSMQCPAVAVELAPLHPVGLHSRGAAPLSDADYQARLVSALAAAMVQWRSESGAANGSHGSVSSAGGAR